MSARGCASCDAAPGSSAPSTALLGAGAGETGNANSTPLDVLPERLEGCATPPVTNDENGGCMTRAQSLFLGMQPASDVPENIRNCWAHESPGRMDAASSRTTTPAIAIPMYPTPDKLRPGLTSELGQIGDGRSAPQAAAPFPPSTFASFPSEAASDVTTGLAGGSWNPPPQYGRPEAVNQSHAVCHGDSVVSRAGARNNGGNGAFDSFVTSPSVGSHYSSMWGGPSMWNAGAMMDGVLEDASADPVAVRLSSSHLSEQSTMAPPMWGAQPLPARAILCHCVWLRLITDFVRF